MRYRPLLFTTHSHTQLTLSPCSTTSIRRGYLSDMAWPGPMQLVAGTRKGRNCYQLAPHVSPLYRTARVIPCFTVYTPT